MTHKLTSFLILTSCICLLPIEGRSAGFEVPELGTRSVARGGAVAARVDDGTAAVLNPGGLSKIKGLLFQYNHNFLIVNSSFARLNPVEAENEPKYLDEAKNTEPFFPLGIFASLAYNLNSDAGDNSNSSVIAFTVNGPNTTGHTKFTDAESTRYLLDELDTLLIYYGLSYAYGTDTFGVGLTAQYVQVPRLNFAITVDADPRKNGRTPSLEPFPFDVNTELRLEDKGTLSGIIGGWWRPTPAVELAVAARPLPIRLKPAGTAAVDVPDELGELVEVSETSAALELDLPAHLRLGIRYRKMEGRHELFDIEFDALFEQWSSLKKYDAKLNGEVTAVSAIAEVLVGEEPLQLQDVVIEKQWEDTVSLRLGGSYWLEPGAIELSAGGFWESAAAPTAYAHLDFPADERMGYGLGASWFMSPSGVHARDGLKIGLSIAFSEAFQRDIDVSRGQGAVYQQRPLRPCPEFCEVGGEPSPGVAANEGKFKTQWKTVSFGLTVQGF